MRETYGVILECLPAPHIRPFHSLQNLHLFRGDLFHHEIAHQATHSSTSYLYCECAPTSQSDDNPRQELARTNLGAKCAY